MALAIGHSVFGWIESSSHCRNTVALRTSLPPCGPRRRPSCPRAYSVSSSGSCSFCALVRALIPLGEVTQRQWATLPNTLIDLTGMPMGRHPLRVFLARRTRVVRLPLSGPKDVLKLLIVGDSAVRLLVTLGARSAWWKAAEKTAQRRRCCSKPKQQLCIQNGTRAHYLNYLQPIASLKNPVGKRVQSPSTNEGG
jgi:hypothetical protein